MASWLGYTVYPHTEGDLEECRDILALELDGAVVEASRFDDPKYVTPHIIEGYEAVGQRMSTSRNVDRPAFRSEVVEWLDRCVDSIAFVFILMYHDTSQAGTLYAYRPEDGQLQEVRSVKVTYSVDRDLRDLNDGHFPEYAALLYPYDLGRGGPDRSRNYISEFEEEFGYRPLTFFA